MDGGAVSSTELDRIKAEQKVDAEAEEQRIFYVAVTRAERHLILSGATDLEKLPESVRPVRADALGVAQLLRRAARRRRIR